MTMLSFYLIANLLVNVIFAEIDYYKTCGTPKCLDYNDGCNDCTCNANDDTVSCTDMQCFHAGTPVCRQCEAGSFWLRFNTYQPPGIASCASRFIMAPVFAQNNSKCACPQDFPFWEPGIGCINEVACDAKVIHKQDTFKYRQPRQGKCSYDYQLCTSDMDCPDELICNIPEDNYETCIPLTARLNKNCDITDCNRCLFDDCMGSGYGYCSKSKDCETGGCSGQLCGPNASQMASTCEWKCEYGCLQYQECGRMDNTGICGWRSPDKEAKKLYKQCMKKCKKGNKPIITTTTVIPSDEECAKNRQCYNPITKECNFYAPCPKRDYCHDAMAPVCKAYPNTECKFTPCGGCYEYFVDFGGNVIIDCDADICTLDKQVGPCLAAIPRYFYNGNTEQCEQFIYGGCHGNANNFLTLEECEKICDGNTVPECVPEGYTFVADPDKCVVIFYVCEDGYIPWSDGECGCGCKPDICALPKVVGPCKAAFNRYWYSEDSGDCEEFIYGGCAGNENNFVSLAECQHSCDADIPDCVPAGYSFLGDPETCQLIRIGCPFDWEPWGDDVCGCGCKPT